MEWTREELLWALALPFGVSLTLTTLLGGWRGGVAVAIGVAYAAAHVGLFIWPVFQGADGVRWPDRAALVELLGKEPVNWAVVWALAAAVVGACVSCTCVSDGAAWLGRLLLTAGLVNTVLWPMIEQWDKLQVLIHVQAVSAIVLVAWWSLDELAERERGMILPMVLTITAVGFLLMAVIGGSKPLIVAVAMLSTALAAGLIVGLLRRSMSWSRGGVAVYVGVTATLLLCAVYYYADGMPKWAALTIGLAPLVGWLGTARPLAAMKPGGRALVVFILVLIPLAAAVVPSAIGVVRGVNPPTPGDSEPAAPAEPSVAPID